MMITELFPLILTHNKCTVIFRDYNVGYPQAREIADAAGNVAYISTSEYARFAEMAIPGVNDWGNVVAIAGY